MAAQSRDKATGVQEGRWSQGRAWPVCQSAVSLSAHQPQVSTYAESHAGQVKPFDQLNHRIYSNWVVIVPKEPGSNELDIIKILMPSFHS